MKLQKRFVLLLALFGSLVSLPCVTGEGNDAGDDDAAAVGDDYIKYWTDYAILPKRCIVYNNVDVIVFSVFPQAYKQCGDTPTGTYYATVPVFVDAYVQQLASNEDDKGNNDYADPDAAQYTQCTELVVDNKSYYLQVGCAEGTSQAISVNVYSDDTCETKESVDLDGANIDVSEIQLPFKQCKACVNWVDKSDDADDAFYENHQMDAPLCSTAWTNKETCDKKCQKAGIEPKQKDGWNTSDKILLTILSFFGAGMLGAILQKRRKMSSKDFLLEQAAMTTAGLQQAHVIGIFVLVVLVITVFALLGLKNITWALLLIMNTALFGYLMKLTVDSGVSTGETVIGPDGTIIRRLDSDDSSVESARSGTNAGTYRLPIVA